MLKPEKIWLKNCIFDEKNPNEMSDEQDASLGQSMGYFGYLGDTVVVNTKDRTGKQLVHHGEHRIKKLIQAGNDWAWGFVKKMSLLDHKAYRQAMNKLHGSHDPEKDRAELEYFAKQHKLEFLSQLIAQPKEQLILAQEAPLDITTDAPMIDHHEDTFLHGNIKQLYFMFSNEQYEEIMPKVDTMMKDFDVDNHTDMFVRLVDFYFKHKQNENTSS
jgi:plasmid maintenance system killer protein